MEIRALLYALCLSLLLGCDPYHFTIRSDESVDGTILSPLGSVTTHLYSLDLHPDAAVQLTLSERTQYRLAAFMRLSGGDGFQIMLRPTVEDKLLDSGLVLTFFTKGGMKLDSAGTTLLENKYFRFPLDSDAMVRVYNEEGFVQAIVGCDTLVKRFSHTIATDDIVFKTLPKSELRVTIPEWTRIKFNKAGEIFTGGMPKP